MIHPATEAILSKIEPELVLAQVWIRRRETAFELRHVEDRDQPAAALRALATQDLRALAQCTASGHFRPLKAAPNLQRGWICKASDIAELESALNHLYPGAVPDWFAAQAKNPPVTSYREMAARQSGMYRVLGTLTDEQAGRVTRVCCDGKFCWKRRLWTVGGLAPDAAADKSVIPCLEPCAVLMEFARSMARLEQEEAKVSAASVAHPTGGEPGEVREADFASPANPRRRMWVEARGDNERIPANLSTESV